MFVAVCCKKCNVVGQGQATTMVRFGAGRFAAVPTAAVAVSLPLLLCHRLSLLDGPGQGPKGVCCWQEARDDVCDCSCR